MVWKMEGLIGLESEVDEGVESVEGIDFFLWNGSVLRD